MGKMFPLLLLVLPWVAPAGAPSAEPGSVEWLRFIAQEVRQLRLEVLADRIERRDANVRQIERDLARLRALAQAEADPQGGQAEELRQIEERLRVPDLDPAQRSSFEDLRAAILARPPAGRVPDREETAALASALGAEQSRLAALRALERALQSASAQR